MRFFIAGIMQGSHADTELHGQDYRDELKSLLREHFPSADIYDPFSDHQQSVAYDDLQGREVFRYHNRLCREVDVIVAFAPQASMGTAIEMWEGHQNGTVVLTISPMTHNWVIRFCSHGIFPDLPAFQAALQAGDILRLIQEHQT